MSEDQLSGAWPSQALPRSWVWLPFDQFWLDVTDSQKKLPQKDYLTEGRFAVVDQGEARIGGFSNDERLLSPAPVPAIVFGDHTRAVKFIDVPFIQGADGVRVLSTPVGIDRAYAFNALRAVELPDKGYSRHFKFLKATNFPLPPLAEQKRIVAKLDALNAKSARARTELARIETLVSRYKQAVLSKAFSGALTRGEWRRLSLGEALRQAQIGLVRSKEQQFANGGTPYVRMNHFDLEGRWHLDDITHVEASAHELQQFALQAGDVLFNTRNSFELVGKVGYWEGSQETFLYNNNILRMRFKDPIASKFAFFQMQSAPFRAYLQSVKSATTSVCAIYQKTLVQAPFVVPTSLTEQHEIVRRIESAFAKIDRLAKEAKRALELVGRLDEAILAKAFRGELVPQDENDEPAELLLARIRAEREAAPKGKRRLKNRA